MRRPEESAGEPSDAGNELLVERTDRVLTVTLNRPAKLNAFTLDMFAALIDLGAQLRNDPTVRVVCFRGAGSRALAAGADISTFTEFTSGDDGVRYEATVARALQAVSDLPQVTLAVIRGLAVGGGLALATACDLRIAGTGARVGYPIAGTLGNCLSAPVLRRCVAVFGDSLVREMLLTARLVDAQRAYAAGAINELADDDQLDAAVNALTTRLAGLAPGTQLATKRILAALAAGEDPHDADEMRKVYGSKDFAAAVQAFMSKGEPRFSAELDLT
ncbi:enoyl-CoA hydratase-related protein [Nakamurella lactea]|uniref:enoyl-CoA hydratase-related protein n=1 Tax=Nakamurella lactea TaxID=459515 RepID=UPI00040F239B|nr:enoyl-CoA hydratase-related protein [Nakamurella lactea]